MEFLDGAKPVRSGEELDLARLAPYLREQLKVPDAEVQVAQFPGGHSNLTYLVTVGGKEYALRRPPFGSKVKSAHDMGREVRVLSKLSSLTSRAPRPILYCEDESILGAKFYLMERVRGVILRKQPPAGLALDEKTCAGLCDSFTSALVELHGVDYAACGLSDFGKPEGYVERQVSGWGKRYLDAQTDEIPEMATVGKWLGENLPPPEAASIVHNDFKFDNLVLDPSDVTKIIAILDWEMATLGDPLMDLGTALCYWVEAGDPDDVKMFGFGPTMLAGMATRRQIVEAYGKKSGRDLSRIGFYFTFGLWKTAVVAQQIYFRFKQGLTRDERFGMFIHGVRIMARQAGEAMVHGVP
jgi:aminoglycoside phosphotransferase (APT) family kinase protein